MQVDKRGADGVQGDNYKEVVNDEIGSHQRPPRGVLKEKYDKESRRLEDLVSQVKADLKNALQSSPE